MLRLTLCAALTSSCTLVYDFGAFEPPEIEPEAMELDSIEPAVVLEGEGCLIAGGDPDGDLSCAPESPKIAVVIEGKNILANAQVALTGLGFDDSPVDATVSSFHNVIAFEVAIPISTELGSDGVEMIEVMVSQEGAPALSQPLMVQGLDELKVTRDGPPQGGVVYSVVDLDAEVTFTGEQPAFIEATSLIAVGARMRASNGCPGGMAGEAAPCGASGGGVGRDGAALGGGANGGGGGGSNADPGIEGMGNDAPNGGSPTPSEVMVSLSEHRGGGGGGAVAADGGAGGGVIAMVSGGSIHIGAEIDLSGVQGGENTEACNPFLIDDPDGGGGGGGAGGSLFLRARTEVVFAEGGLASIGGGLGGLGGGGECSGGDGSAGRIRIDTPSLVGDPSVFVDAGEAEVQLVGAAVIAPQSLTRTGEARQEIEVAGDDRRTSFLVAGSESLEFRIGDPSALELANGFNKVCAFAVNPSDLMQVPREVEHCVNFAYLP